MEEMMMKKHMTDRDIALQRDLAKTSHAASPKTPDFHSRSAEDRCERRGDGGLVLPKRGTIK
jgi:hypothetical protein